MTRKELERKSREKKEKRFQRIEKTLELFIDNKGNITDEELAHILILEGIETSSSTVGRDLTCNLKKLFIESNRLNNPDCGDELNSAQASVIAFVTKKRNDSKHNGRIKGGTNYYKNNDYKKDLFGHFVGSRKVR